MTAIPVYTSSRTRFSTVYIVTSPLARSRLISSLPARRTLLIRDLIALQGQHLLPRIDHGLDVGAEGVVVEVVVVLGVSIEHNYF